MKVSFKFATGLVLAAGLLVASSNAALAGEGGAAGSVSIKFAATPLIGTPDVARLSSSVAVGKNFAAATSLTETSPTGETRTSAIGGGGIATLSNANAVGAGYLGTAETADTLNINQKNEFGTGSKASLAPTTGVTLP